MILFVSSKMSIGAEKGIYNHQLLKVTLLALSSEVDYRI